MTLVRPGMDSDSLRPHTLTVYGKLLNVRIILSTGIAQRGHLVDIDT